MRALEAKTRVTLRNILFTTDFSSVSEGAASYALKLASNHQARIFALHVRPPDIYGMAPPESWPVLREAGEEQAKAQAAQLDGYFGEVAHEVIVAEGDTWDSISACIAKNNIDLVVMGTHGRRGLGKVLIGSVAESVLRNAPCPVLTVNAHVQLSPERVVAMKRILLATSFSEASELAAAYAISFAQENQSQLDIVHVIESQKAGELVHPSELTAGCTTRMKGLIPAEADLWCEPHTMIEVGDPAEQILSVAKARRTELIVMGVKAAALVPGVTHIPWATAHKIISAAECPVLTVHV
jgi:nucleotide-binding universal stress UspA family protein